MTQEIMERQDLLDDNGNVRVAGWSQNFMLNYNKEKIALPATSLKEWDYHVVLNEDFAVACSMANVGIASRLTLHFIDFNTNQIICKNCMFDNDSEKFLEMPTDLEGGIHFEHDGVEGKITRSGQDSTLYVKYPGFYEDQTAIWELKMHSYTNRIVLLVPYEDPKLFYYNMKDNCMDSEGYFTLGDKRYEIDERSMTTRDWGRGLWEPTNQWYWASLSTKLNGKNFGFNLGCGFGDRSRVSENIVYYDNVGYKLGDISIEIPGDQMGNYDFVLPNENYMQNWSFSTPDGRLKLVFEPRLDRMSGTDVTEGYRSVQHQVFGYYTGEFVMDDGEILKIERAFGFAEKVANFW